MRGVISWGRKQSTARDIAKQSGAAGVHQGAMHMNKPFRHRHIGLLAMAMFLPPLPFLRAEDGTAVAKQESPKETSGSGMALVHDSKPVGCIVCAANEGAMVKEAAELVAQGLGQMGVDLRGSQAGMAQQDLDEADVHATVVIGSFSKPRTRRPRRTRRRCCAAARRRGCGPANGCRSPAAGAAHRHATGSATPGPSP